MTKRKIKPGLYRHFNGGMYRGEVVENGVLPGQMEIEVA